MSPDDWPDCALPSCGRLTPADQSSAYCSEVCRAKAHLDHRVPCEGGCGRLGYPPSRCTECFPRCDFKHGCDRPVVGVIRDVNGEWPLNYCQRHIPASASMEEVRRSLAEMGELLKPHIPKLLIMWALAAGIGAGVSLMLGSEEFAVSFLRWGWVGPLWLVGIMWIWKRTSGPDENTTQPDTTQ